MKQVSSSLKLELAQYHEMQAFSKFGSDLDESTKHILEHGAKLTELLKQPQYEPMPLAEQILSLFAAKNSYLKKIDVKNVRRYEKEMLKMMRNEHSEILDEIVNKEMIDDQLNEKIKDVLNKFTADFISEIEA